MHPTTRRPIVFVSHASDDKPRLKSVVQALLQAGFVVWIDNPRALGLEPHPNLQRIKAYENWSSSIEQGLARCDCVLVVWSRHTAPASSQQPLVQQPRRRENVHEEARSGKNEGKLVQVAIDPLDELRLPYGFNERQVIDLGRGAGADGLPKAALGDLIEDIKDLANERAEFGRSSQQASSVIVEQHLPSGFEQTQTSRQWLLPYAVDRVHQETTLGRELLPALSQEPRLQSLHVIVVHGAADALHEKFVQVANARLVRGETEPLGYPHGWRLVNIPWPDSDHASQHMALSERLAAYISRCCKQLGLPSRFAYASPVTAAKGLSEWLADNNEPIALYSRLPEHTKRDTALFRACIEWLAKIELSTNRIPVAKIFYLYAPPVAVKRGWLSFNSPSHDRIVARLPDGHLGPAKIIKLPKLGEISPENVADWIDDVEKRAASGWSDGRRRSLEACMHQIFEQHDTRSLRHVSELLEEALMECGLGPSVLAD